MAETSTGTILICPRCGCEHRRRYVPADALNDARAERDEAVARAERAEALFERLADDEMTEAVARKAWDYAEDRERRIHEAERGRPYKRTSWEEAHDLDRVEYSQYVTFILAAARAALDAGGKEQDG